ncbi:MAG: C39 family peptidase [Anaerolineales bacterium]|jgi:hypothetical protein
MDTNIPANTGPIYYRDLSEEELLPYFQSQLPGSAQGCGPFSIAMAANLCNRNQQGSNYLGADVQAILEQKGLKLRGFGMPTWLDYGRSLGDFAHKRVEHKRKASIDDLELAISNNKIVIVALAWQTTWEILRDIRHATVGHYMVAVGFDKQGGVLIFLNPGLDLKEGASHLYVMSFQEFNTYWNEKSNLFVQAGSMWTISP